MSFPSLEPTDAVALQEIVASYKSAESRFGLLVFIGLCPALGDTEI